MSSFAGVSMVIGSKVHTTPAFDAGTDSGYHLLVVKDYSRTIKEIRNGVSIWSGSFMVGGHQWCIKYYPNGCLTIRCDIMVCKDLNTHDADGTMYDIHQHLDHLLQNKVGADVTFEVSGETFAAHRCVLAARSKVFMAQLFGPMMEGTASSAIEIKDMKAKVFAALLKFIYTDSFPEMDNDNYMEEEEGQEEEERKDEEDGQEEEEGQDEEEGQEDEGHEEEDEQYEEEGHEDDVMWLQWLQDLLVAADRYDLQRLKFLCGKQLSEHIDVSSVASLLILAEQYQCKGLKEACFKFIQVQSPKCLDKVMASDGWEHMSTAHPSILKEFIAKILSNQKDKKRKW